MATGLAAPFVAWELVRGRGRRLAVGFNVFGLADLIDAATLGVLLGLGLFAVEPTTEILAFLPLALVPTVAVPVAITLHIVSLRQLRAGRPRHGSAHVHDHPYWRADHWCPKGDHSGPGLPACQRPWAPVALIVVAARRAGSRSGLPLSPASQRPMKITNSGPLSRQAPQPPHGRLLHGTGLAAGRRALERPPACTHPLLAAVARQVNDHLSDPGRQRLADLIPSVIGLTGEDLHIDARIALRSATITLPVVAAERQRVMAVSVLTCERVLAELDGRAAGALEEQSRRALAEVPQAAEWAYQFTSGVRPSHKGFRRQTAPTIVQDAVQGIAPACVPDPDKILDDLLVQTIDVCAAWIGRDPDHGGMVDHSLWVSACQRTENQYR